MRELWAAEARSRVIDVAGASREGARCRASPCPSGLVGRARRALPPRLGSVNRPVRSLRSMPSGREGGFRSWLPLHAAPSIAYSSLLRALLVHGRARSVCVSRDRAIASSQSRGQFGSPTGSRERILFVIVVAISESKSGLASEFRPGRPLRGRRFSTEIRSASPNAGAEPPRMKRGGRRAEGSGGPRQQPNGSRPRVGSAAAERAARARVRGVMGGFVVL